MSLWPYIRSWRQLEFYYPIILKLAYNSRIKTDTHSRLRCQMYAFVYMYMFVARLAAVKAASTPTLSKPAQ